MKRRSNGLSINKNLGEHTYALTEIFSKQYKYGDNGDSSAEEITVVTSIQTQCYFTNTFLPFKIYIPRVG